MPDLLMEYGDTAMIQGQQKKLLNKYGRISLLIIDEWLVSDISDAELYFRCYCMSKKGECFPFYHCFFGSVFVRIKV